MRVVVLSLRSSVCVYSRGLLDVHTQISTRIIAVTNLKGPHPPTLSVSVFLVVVPLVSYLSFLCVASFFLCPPLSPVSVLSSFLFFVLSFLFVLSSLSVVGLSLDSSFVWVHSEFMSSFIPNIDGLLMCCFIHFSALFRVCTSALWHSQCLQVHLRFTS